VESILSTPLVRISFAFHLGSVATVLCCPLSYFSSVLGTARWLFENSTKKT
jgi:hypothetical protein